VAEAAGEETMRNFRPSAYLGLFLALVLLASVFAWILIRFGTPQAQLVYAGEAKDYLPGQAPRLVFSKNGESFYVLNLEGELIALSATSKAHSIRCLVHWQAPMNAFVDPCLGTRFSPGGAYSGGGPPGELERLPIQVQDGRLWVNLGYK
jgi:hypothetical protein